MSRLTENQTKLYYAGLFDSWGRVYNDAVMVYTRNDAVKRDLKRHFGGTIEATRWVVRSKARRIKFLSTVIEYSPYRVAEIEAALDNLGEAP